MTALLLLVAVAATIASSVQGAGINPEQVHISATGIILKIDRRCTCTISRFRTGVEGLARLCVPTWSLSSNTLFCMWLRSRIFPALRRVFWLFIEFKTGLSAWAVTFYGGCDFLKNLFLQGWWHQPRGCSSAMPWYMVRIYNMFPV